MYLLQDEELKSVMCDIFMVLKGNDRISLIQLSLSPAAVGLKYI